MTELPRSLEALLARLQETYDEATAAQIFETFRAPKDTAFILNPLVAAPFDNPCEPVPGLEGCFLVPPAERASLLADPAVTAGHVYPINPSSVLAANALTVDESMEVLDLAAAPGGKTLLLAIAMNNRGRIAAVEAVKGRFHRMRANLERCGVRNVQAYLADGRSIGRKVPERFDRVLLDAPCSSEARIRLDDPGSYAHWKPRKVKEAARKQRGLIRSAFAALKPRGELLYCTCSFAPEECELIVDYLLNAEPAARLLPLNHTPGRSGLRSWAGRDLKDSLDGCRRILPDGTYDGFFLARIGKD